MIFKLNLSHTSFLEWVWTKYILNGKNILTPVVLNTQCKPIEAETTWMPYPDAIFKCIFLNEKICILIQIPVKFVPKSLIANTSALA